MTRRPQILLLAILLGAGGLAAGLVAAFGSESPSRAATNPPAHAVVLRGNGLGAADFGQPEATAVADLRAELGPPKSGRPINMSGSCTIDSAVEWPAMTAYFLHGDFVGYATESLLGGPGNDGVPDVVTAAGLRIGDALTRAARLYGGALQTSYAQGGSWFAVTSTGTLAGYLTSEVNSTNPVPRIADITAGSVGCPAMSP